LLLFAVILFVIVAVVKTVLDVLGYLVLPVTNEGKLLAIGFLALLGSLIVFAARSARSANSAAPASGPARGCVPSRRRPMNGSFRFRCSRA